MNGYYTKFKNEAGQYRFNLKSGNHEIILHSEDYVSSAGCDTGIASVKKNSPHAERYDRRTSKDQKFYFVLIATNGEIIGVSETYNTASARDEGIRDVMRLGPNSPIKDQT